jgi:hypothetical protein
MSAHTPGPWALDPCASGWTLIANGQDITSEPFDACDADARLIAAAPELLAALQAILHDTTHDLVGLPRDEALELIFAIADTAHAAIQRATGGAP